jgi:hypothetical protein
MQFPSSRAMTEIIEYSLVVMVSALFIAGSAETYTSFTSYQASIQLRAEFLAVSGLASQAVKDGNSSGTLSLPTSTLRCERGSLSLSAGSSIQSYNLPLGCDFKVDVSEGLHFIMFSAQSSNLALTVR